MSSDAIHNHFGLTYANYLVLPRTLLQSMPADWQQRFVACLQEYNAAFDAVETPDAYQVTAGREVEYAELTYAQRRYLGITKEKLSAKQADEREPLFYDKDGNEREGWHTAILPVPDELQDYQRGRRHIAPDLEAIARVQAEGQGTIADEPIAAEQLLLLVRAARIVYEHTQRLALGAPVKGELRAQAITIVAKLAEVDERLTKWDERHRKQQTKVDATKPQ